MKPLTNNVNHMLTSVNKCTSQNITASTTATIAQFQSTIGFPCSWAKYG